MKSAILQLTQDGSTPVPTGTNVQIFAGDDNELASPLDSGFTNAAGIYATIPLPEGVMYQFQESSGDIGSGSFFNGLFAQDIQLYPSHVTGAYPLAPSPPAPPTPYLVGWMAVDVVANAGQWTEDSGGNVEFNGASITQNYPESAFTGSAYWTGISWEDGISSDIGKLIATPPEVLLSGPYSNFIIETWMSAGPFGVASASTDGYMFLRANPRISTSAAPFIQIPGVTGINAQYVNGALAESTGFPELSMYGVWWAQSSLWQTPGSLWFEYGYQDNNKIMASLTGSAQFKLRAAIKVTALA